MKDTIKILKRDHERVREILQRLVSFSRESVASVQPVANLLHDLGKIWDGHELMEENLFLTYGSDKNLPEGAMFLEQHRELKGHWKVLQDAVASGNSEELKIALDTDGKMLIDKFEQHLKAEEEYFDVLEGN